MRRSTRERYALSLGYIDQGLGAYQVDAVRASDVRAWQAGLAARGLAPSTCNGHLRVLRQVLTAAVADGLAPANAAGMVPPLREGVTRGRRGQSLGAADFRALLDAVQTLSWPVVLGSPSPSPRPPGRISEDISRALLVLAWTGARRGEVLALRFRDLEGGELRLERAVWRGEVRTTKTDDPRRVALTSPLRRVLTEQRQWLLRVQHPVLTAEDPEVRDLVFPARACAAAGGARRRAREGGRSALSWYRAGSSLTEPLDRAVEAAGLPGLSPHALRRTVENLGRQAGIDALVRRATSGWRSERAQGIYATVGREEREAAAQVFEAYVLGGGG